MRNLLHLRRVRAGVRRLLGDRTGAVLIVTALSMPALVGFTGLSIDVGSWYMHRRAVQAAADAAAVAGALEVLRRGDEADWNGAARNDAARNGYGAVAGDAITVNYPPVDGPHAGVGNAVEVVVTRQSQAYFSQIFLDDPFPIAARSVAVADINDTCVWALDPSVQGAVTVQGSAEVELSCGVIVNSNDATGALMEKGSACLRATRVKVVGGSYGNCIEPSPITDVPPVHDPLAALQPPPVPPACDYQNLSIGGSISLSPGRYCGSIKFNAGANVTFEPGVYILDGASFDVNGQAVVNGTGVTFYLTADNGEQIHFNGGATVNLSAPTTGPYAGILFYQDRDGPYVEHAFNGGSTMELDGILYFPNQKLEFHGGSSVGKSPAMLVVKSVLFTGNSSFGNFENSAASSNASLIEAYIVE